MKFCIWHKHSNRIAVNLAGSRLEKLSRDEAAWMLELMHPRVREQVEVRPMKEVN